jgi:hypothetical protein
MKYVVEVSIETSDHFEKKKHFIVDCERDEIPGETTEQVVLWCSRSGLNYDDVAWDIIKVQPVWSA